MQCSSPAVASISMSLNPFIFPVILASWEPSPSKSLDIFKLQFIPPYRVCVLFFIDLRKPKSEKNHMRTLVFKGCYKTLDVNIYIGHKNCTTLDLWSTKKLITQKIIKIHPNSTGAFQTNINKKDTLYSHGITLYVLVYIQASWMFQSKELQHFVDPLKKIFCLMFDVLFVDKEEWCMIKYSFGTYLWCFVTPKRQPVYVCGLPKPVYL